MKDKKICPPCLVGQVVTLGLLGWLLFSLYSCVTT